MTEIRPPKKSESVEVRLPFEAKRDFLAACKAEGRTASEVIRGAIDAYVGHRNRPETGSARDASGKLATLVPKPLRRKRYLAVGAASVAGLAVLAALPSAAAASNADKAAAFSKLDSNADGVVSYREFIAR